MIKNLRLKLAEAGKLKIGGLAAPMKSRKGNTFRPPRKDDHWTVTGTTRDAAGDLEINRPLMSQLVQDGYADSDGQVRTLPIVLHADEIEAVFRTSYARYQGRKCACEGDGETATKREIGPEGYTGNTKETPCPCELLDSGKCKPHGKLLCSLRVPSQAVAGAVYCFRTTSIITIEQIVGSLTQILAAVGTLQGLPLVLRVLPMQVTPKGRSTTVYVVHIELHATDLAEAQQNALQRLEARSIVQDRALESYQRALMAPESDEDAADTQREFYSETEQEEAEAAGWDKPEDAAPPAWGSPPPAEEPAGDTMPAWGGGAVDVPAEPVPPARPVMPKEPDSPPETASSTDGPGPRPPGGSPPQPGRRRGACPVCGDGFYPEDRAPGAGLMCKWCAAEPPAEPADEPTTELLPIIDRIKVEIARGMEAGLLEPTIRTAMQRDGVPLDDPLELRDRHPGMAYMVVEHLLAEMAASKP